MRPVPFLLRPWNTPEGYKPGIALAAYNRSKRQPSIRLVGREGKHGTANTYQLGCRCEPCRAYQCEYRRRWRAKQKAD